MKLRLITLTGLLICLGIAASAFAQGKMMSDPVSGHWTGDWGPSAMDRNQIAADFKFDGKAVTGSITPEGQSAIPIQKGTFDAKTGSVHLEADVKAPRGGEMVHYVIDGKLSKDMMSGSWVHDNRKGDFSISKTEN
jgi:hypothetical protein